MGKEDRRGEDGKGKKRRMGKEGREEEEGGKGR